MKAWSHWGSTCLGEPAGRTCCTFTEVLPAANYGSSRSRLKTANITKLGIIKKHDDATQWNSRISSYVVTPSITYLLTILLWIEKQRDFLSTKMFASQIKSWNYEKVRMHDKKKKTAWPFSQVKGDVIFIIKIQNSLAGQQKSQP